MKMLGFKFTLVIFVLLFTDGASHVVHDRQAVSYVVERGCMFLAHYVRKNYYSYVPDYPPTTSTSTTISMTTAQSHINWVTYLYDTLRADYVPMDLFKGLMNCGKEYSMYAIDAPEWLRATLGINYHAVPGLG